MIQDAFRALVGAPFLCALRPSGPQVVMKRSGMLVQMNCPRPRRFTGNLSDFCALDWEVVKISDLVRAMQQQQSAAAQASSSGEGGPSNG